MNRRNFMQATAAVGTALGFRLPVAAAGDAEFDAMMALEPGWYVARRVSIKGYAYICGNYGEPEILYSIVRIPFNRALRQGIVRLLLDRLDGDTVNGLLADSMELRDEGDTPESMRRDLLREEPDRDSPAIESSITGGRYLSWSQRFGYLPLPDEFDKPSMLDIRRTKWGSHYE